jgi:hypothetical protein
MGVTPPTNLPPDAQPWGRWASDQILAIQSQLGNLSQVTGNGSKANSSSIDLLSNKIVGIQNSVTGLIAAATFDASQIVSGTLSGARMPNLNANTLYGAVSTSLLSGGIANDVSAANVSGTNVTGTNIFAVNAGNISGNITTSRTSTWARNSDGYIGNTLSSIAFKTNISPANLNVDAILSIEPKHYWWKSAVADKLKNPKLNIHEEIGFIAEDVHNAGLWEFVVYQRNDDDSAKLDTNGNAIPQALHYINWGIALQAVARSQDLIIKQLQADVAILKGKIAPAVK